MRKIALDVGDKTVGIALSDALGITAQGLMKMCIRDSSRSG